MWYNMKRLYSVLDLSLSRLHGKLRNSSTSLRKQGEDPVVVVVVGKYSFGNYVAGVKKSLFFSTRQDNTGRQVRER